VVHLPFTSTETHICTIWKIGVRKSGRRSLLVDVVAVVNVGVQLSDEISVSYSTLVLCRFLPHVSVQQRAAVSDKY